MKHLHVVGLACVSALLAGPAHAQPQDPKAAQGLKVYTAQKCSLCHSIGGHGNAKGPLDDVGTKLTADEIRQWVVNAKEMAVKTKSTRKPPMKNYALPKDDADALVAYLQTLKGKGKPGAAAKPGTATSKTTTTAAKTTTTTAKATAPKTTTSKK